MYNDQNVDNVNVDNNVYILLKKLNFYLNFKWLLNNYQKYNN